MMQPADTAIMRLLLTALALFVAGTAQGAALPPHPPLRILIVSDEVNPHGLPDSALTQPGDISTALLSPGSGLNLDLSPNGVLEIATDDLDQATTALSTHPDDPAGYDVLIYFAHRIPAGGAVLQADFVTAVDSFLARGGGMVSFHHGAYFTAGKEAMQERIGASATGSVPWDTIDGQNVINTAPGHFITTNGVEYTGSTAYTDAGRGVSAGTYDYFNNTPDERYINFEIEPGAGDFQVLFGSNYDQNGTSHLLGFIHTRPQWQGVVVGYQPGEFQPNALDDLDGNNFQILANSILFASGNPVVAVPEHLPAPLPLAGRPNPFRQQTRIQLGDTQHRVSLSVFDVTGRLVITRDLPAGASEFSWNGADRTGRRSPAGVYFLRASSGRQTGSARLVLLP